MTIKEEAIRLLNLGFSVIPVGADKRPLVKWDKYMKIKMASEDTSCFDSAPAIAIIGGQVSGNLECIDLDVKYDIDDSCMDFLQHITKYEGLIIQQTPSGGFHLIYRIADGKPDGNSKIAGRAPVFGEDDKIKKLYFIESRGEGGYFLIDPSPKYDLGGSDLANIPTITWEQRCEIWDIARTYNTLVEEHKIDIHNAPVTTTDEWIKSPGDDYNDKASIQSLLESHGWTRVYPSRGAKDFYKRPGSTSVQNANWDNEKKWFTVFTPNTGFEVQKAYKLWHVFTELEHRGNYKEAVKDLISKGYGVKRQEDKVIQIVTDIKDIVSDSDRDHNRIEQFLRGEIPMGLPTGDPALDDYYRFKMNFVVVNGHSNIGKSFMSWFLLAIAARRHGWKVMICTTEVLSEWCRYHLYEFYLGKQLQYATSDEKRRAKEWVDEYFIIIRGSEFDFTYKKFIDDAVNVYNKKKFTALLFDPFNAMLRERGYGNSHDYDYEAVSSFRRFSVDMQVAFWLNVHTTTESIKRKDKDGFFLPPDAGDTEGGNKFLARSDDFLTFHRLTNHPTDYLTTQIHVRKIKETRTGGKPTKKDHPILWQYNNGGFVNRDSRINPMDYDYKCYQAPSDIPG